MEVWRTGGDKLTLEGLLRGEELSSVASVLAIQSTPWSSEKSTEEDGRKSNCSPREISEESKYKFNTESGFEVEEEV